VIEMGVQDIRKYKPCKYASIDKTTEEVNIVMEQMGNPVMRGKSSFNIHKVPVGGIEYLVADAKYLNRHTNQDGRGNLRYLFDPKTREYSGLAKEIDRGDYRPVA
jgi:hypothetical protein